MSTELTPEQVEQFKEERRIDSTIEPSTNLEVVKTLSTVGINVIIIALFVWAAMNTPTDMSTRFMSLLEMVIGAIFGVTATQIAKDHG